MTSRNAARVAVAGLTALLPGCALATPRMGAAGVDVDCRLSAASDAGVTIDAEPGEWAGVLWMREAERRDHELSAAWCATVGEPALRDRAERFAPASEADSLVIVTWNMNVGGGDLVGFLENEMRISCGEPARDESLDAPAAFVLLLQEVYRRSDRLPHAPRSSLVPRTIDSEHPGAREGDVVEIAARCGLSLVYVPSMRNGPDSGARPKEDKGNAILSTLTLSNAAAVDLPFEAYRRVAVAAETRTGGHAPLRVVSTHLDVSGLPFRVLVSGNQTRARQASGLVDALDLLDRLRPVGSGTIVGADMNTWAPESAAMVRMRRALPDSPAYDDQPTRGIFPTDHIFFRTGSEGPAASGYRVVERDYGSDHKARALLLTWSRAGGGR